MTILTGWRRNLLAFALGICATLALPPVYLFPMLIPAFTGLLLLARDAPNGRRAFFDGWWWGLGHYITSLYWICISMLVDPAQFGWLIPFTLFGLNGVIALYPALAMLLWHKIHPAQRSTQPIVFAAIWGLTEYARGHLFTGFPWNLAGYGWAFSDSVSQSASVIGIYGLTFVTVLAACALAGGKKQAILCWLLLPAMAAGGAYRLHMADVTPEAGRFVSGVRLRLVQADIDQMQKWEPARQRQTLDTYIRLSTGPGYDRITHIIWPETALPYALERNTPLERLLASVAPPEGALITGALREEGEGRDWRAWNSLAVITRNGIAAMYDKHHLVPFGEYVPLRAWLPRIVTPAGIGDLARGSGPETLAIPGAPDASPLICYEAIFPGEAVAPAGPRPRWLLNITNDAWFGDSSGPYQHFVMARFRAIEQGLPLVRAANTGISGVTDAYGRVVTRLGLKERGVVDSPLPVGLASTIYGSMGDKYSLLLMSIIILFTLYARSPVARR